MANKKQSLKLFSFFFLLTIGVSRGGMQEDEKECAEVLATLASCIPYVSGSAVKPTKECCEATVKLKAAKPKCLCVLIKESTDPSMALPVNTTLALQMPSACNIDAKVSDCPTILKLPPDSPDAKIFKVANTDSATPPSSSSSSSSPSSTTFGGSNSNAEKKANPNSSKGSATLEMLGIGGVFASLLSVAFMLS